MLVGEGFAQALSPDGTRVLAVVPADPPAARRPPAAASAGQPRRSHRAGWRGSPGPTGFRTAAASSSPESSRGTASGSTSATRKAAKPGRSAPKESSSITIRASRFRRTGGAWPRLQADGRLAVFSTDGGEGRAIPNLPPGVVPIAWTADSRGLFAYAIVGLPARVLRIDPESGKAEPWKELLVADGTGVHGLPSLRMTGDGRAYAYSYYRALSELFSVDGLR